MAYSSSNLILSLSLLVIALHGPFLYVAAREHSAKHARAWRQSTAPLFRGSGGGDVLFQNGNVGLSRASFPDDFLFGAITTSMKHEGVTVGDTRPDNIWDMYALKEGATLDGTLPRQCGNNYDLFKTDHQLMAGLGMNSYRLSLAWSRIFPNGSGDVNEEAIAHYNEVINDVLDQGLTPMVTLWSQDHPHIIEAQYGGALDARFISDFVNYADTCFKAFGDRVKLWITFDEANDWSGLGYSTSMNPPGRCTSGLMEPTSDVDLGECPDGDSGTEPYIVGHNMLIAHAEAVDIYRTKYQPSQNGSIGMALWFRWLEPLTNSSADVEGANRGEEFLMGWFLDPIFFGDYPPTMREFAGSRLPNFTTEEIAKIRGSLDFIGLNLQFAYYAFARDFYANQSEKCYYFDWGVDFTSERDNVPIGKGDHEHIVPWCMKRGIDYIKNRYNNFPMYITQTGWGISYNESATLEEKLDDGDRVAFYESYYFELSRAINEGANVKGVYAWSLIDGFEFYLGMDIRVGLFYVDDQYNRHPRKSAMWFKEMLAQNTSTMLVV